MQYGKEGEYDLYFFYDDNDQPLGFYYTDVFTSDTGDKYYFVLNAQGDVVQIRDKTNDVVANYHYDAWGKLLSITDADGDAITNKLSIALKNPIRYRGYVYDNETGFYYLNTRYYDPSLRRFINADTTDILNESKDALTDKNLYAYCDNNPVMRSDDGGEFWLELALGAIAVTAVATVVIMSAPALAVAGVGATVIAGTTSVATSVGIVSTGVAIGAWVIGISEEIENDYVTSRNKNKKSGYDPDPYKRPGQKKQQRERKEKKKKNGWEPNPNKRQMPPKKHTPGRDHRKYW